MPSNIMRLESMMVDYYMTRNGKILSFRFMSITFFIFSMLCERKMLQENVAFHNVLKKVKSY